MFEEAVTNLSLEGGLRSRLDTPERNLQVTYVVPIQGEVANANIFNQLKDYARQSVDPDTFEIIYAVNNTSEDAAAQSESFTENQRLFEILEFASNASDIPPDLPEWQLGILRAVRDAGVKIQILDLSTGGLQERNIEEARTRGDNLAIARFEQTAIKADGAIVMMDADTRIAPDYTSEIVRQLVNEPDVGMLRIQYDERPGEGGERLYETTVQTRFIHTISNFMQSLHGGYGQGGWYAIKAGALGAQDPQYASAVGRDVLRPRFGTLRYATNLTPFTQDRARPEIVGGQFGARRFDEVNWAGSSVRAAQTIEDPVLDELSGIYSSLRESGSLTPSIEHDIFAAMRLLVQDQDLDKYITLLHADRYARYRDETRDLFGRNSIPMFDYPERALAMISSLISESPYELMMLNDLIAESEKRERIRHAHSSKNVDLILSRAFAQSDPNNITADTLLAGHLDSSLAHFLGMNPWIVDTARQVREDAADVQTARELLDKRFPELLVPFEQTMYTRAQSILLGLNEFLKRVQAGPQDFPRAASFFVG